MIYHRILNPDTGVEGFMELYDNAVVRLTDLDGNTADVPVYVVTEVNASPAWALPDPEPPAPETPPVPVPDVVTKRQFLIQLLRSGMVTAEEVPTLASQPPALMAAVLAAMPEEQALEANLSWAAMTQVERFSPLTLAAAAAAGTTEAQLDEFFIAAAQI